MKVKSSISGMLILILIASCKNPQKVETNLRTIDVASNINNMQQLNLSQFTDNIRYVVLENRVDIEVGSYMAFDLLDNLLLTINSGKESALLLFDMSGKLVAKFGKIGRGPEEYLNVNNLCFVKNGKIYFNSMTDLIEFNPDGSFSKKYPGYMLIENEFYLHQWCMLGDTLIFGHIQNDSGQTKYKAILINKDGKVRRYYLNYDLFENKRSRVVGGSTQIFKFKGALHFKEQFIDTLFALNSDYKLIPKYSFYLGNLKMPASLRVNFREYFEKMNNYIAIEDIFETEDYLFLKVNLGNKFPARRLTPKPRETRIAPEQIISHNELIELTNTTFCLGIYDKKSSELNFCKPTSTDNSLFTSDIYNDLDAGPRFFPRKQIDDSTMIMTVSAKDLKNHIESDDFKNSTPKNPEKKKELEKLSNALSEFDNPVLMIVTFKSK